MQHCCHWTQEQRTPEDVPRAAMRSATQPPRERKRSLAALAAETAANTCELVIKGDTLMMQTQGTLIAWVVAKVPEDHQLRQRATEAAADALEVLVDCGCSLKSAHRAVKRHLQARERRSEAGATAATTAATVCELMVKGQHATTAGPGDLTNVKQAVCQVAVKACDVAVQSEAAMEGLFDRDKKCLREAALAAAADVCDFTLMAEAATAQGGLLLAQGLDEQQQREVQRRMAAAVEAASVQSGQLAMEAVAAVGMALSSLGEFEDDSDFDRNVRAPSSSSSSEAPHEGCAAVAIEGLSSSKTCVCAVPASSWFQVFR